MIKISILNKIDDYMIINMPLLWSLKIHYVIFYSLIINILLSLFILSIPFKLGGVQTFPIVGYTLIFIEIIVLFVWRNNIIKYKSEVIFSNNKSLSFLRDTLGFLTIIFFIFLPSITFTFPFQYKSEQLISKSEVDEFNKYAISYSRDFRNSGNSPNAQSILMDSLNNDIYKGNLSHYSTLKDLVTKFGYRKYKNNEKLEEYFRDNIEYAIDELYMVSNITYIGLFEKYNTEINKFRYSQYLFLVMLFPILFIFFNTKLKEFIITIVFVLLTIGTLLYIKREYLSIMDYQNYNPNMYLYFWIGVFIIALIYTINIMTLKKLKSYKLFRSALSSSFIISLPLSIYLISAQNNKLELMYLGLIFPFFTLFWLKKTYDYMNTLPKKQTVCNKELW